MKKLKQEINLRYNIVQYKKLMKNYILNRFEKNNLQIIYNAIESIKLNNFWGKIFLWE